MLVGAGSNGAASAGTSKRLRDQLIHTPPRSIVVLVHWMNTMLETPNVVDSTMKYDLVLDAPK